MIPPKPSILNPIILLMVRRLIDYECGHRDRKHLLTSDKHPKAGLETRVFCFFCFFFPSFLAPFLMWQKRDHNTCQKKASSYSHTQ